MDIRYLRIASIPLLAAVLLTAKPVVAEEIYLRDGTKIVGSIVAVERDAFRVETDFGFALIRKDRIDRIVFPESASKEAAPQEGEPAPASAERTAPKEAVAKKPEPATAEKEVSPERLPIPPIPPPTPVVLEPTQTAPEIWTNYHIGLLGGIVSVVGIRSPPREERQEAEEEEAAPEAEEAADPWTQLEQAHKEREMLENYTAVLGRQVEEWTGEWRSTTDQELRESLGATIERAEENLASQQDQMEELDARIAALEEQTKDRERPAPEPAPQAGTQAPLPPPSR